MKKRYLSLLLGIILSLTIVQAGAASTAQEISSRLSLISQTNGYTVGTFLETGACWKFADKVSHALFGVSIPAGTNGLYYLSGAATNPYWELIKTCPGGVGANSSIRTLLNQAKPGDLLQYRSSTTFSYTDSSKTQKSYKQHTAIVYAVSDYGISIYDHTSSGIQIRTSAWSQLFSLNGVQGIGSFETGLANAGLSLYRCNSNVLSTGPINNSDKKVSVSVTTGAADTITETSAILRGSFKVINGRASECGMYLGTSANDTPWLGSDTVNTTGTSMFYSTSKYGRTLQPGTTYWYQAYAIVNGTKYCGKLESFITPGTTKVEPTPVAPTPVEGNLSISKSHMTMKVGTCNQITATTTPAGQPVSWESTNPDVATVSNGVVTANKPGTTTINISMNYGGTSYLSLCSVTVEAAAPPVESTPAVDLSVSGVTNLSQNSARVNASCSYSNGDRPNAVGLYLGTSSSAMSFYKSDEGINHNKNPFDIWYNLSGLSAGTTYYYQFYATVGNKTVWSSVNSFTTTAAPVQVSNTRSAVVVNTNGQYLAINNAPAASPKYSQQIGRIPPGGTVTVYPDKTSGNWYYVEYNGVSGYAYNKYLALQ